MTSSQIQCFIEAASRLNFTAAAEKLYISQPALSRSISALEDELQLLFFVRRNNVLSLTPGGKIIYDWLKEEKTSFDDMLAEARHANSEEKNELRIAFVRNEIPPDSIAVRVAEFKSHHPELELEITHYDTAQAVIRELTEHNTDIAVMIGSQPFKNDRLCCREICRFRRCAVVPLLHPLAGAKRASIKDFSGDRFVSIVPASSPTITPMLKEICSEAGFTPKIIEAQDIQQFISWVESGKGVTLLYNMHAERHNPLLRFIELEEYYPVNLVFTWDRLNANPNIAEFFSGFEKDG